MRGQKRCVRDIHQVSPGKECGGLIAISVQCYQRWPSELPALGNIEQEGALHPACCDRDSAATSLKWRADVSVYLEARARVDRAAATITLVVAGVALGAKRASAAGNEKRANQQRSAASPVLVLIMS